MFEVNGFEVNFSYYDKDNEGPYTIDDTDLFSRITDCEIYFNGELVALGVAYCSKQDQFVKYKGRKLALTRALEDGLFDKKERTGFWNKYWSLVKKA